MGANQISYPASNVLDDQANTDAVSQEKTDPALVIALAADSSIGKVSIFPSQKTSKRHKFAPTASAPILVGVRNSACPAEGCSKTGLLCGTLTVSKAAGPYIVDCGGKKAKYVWIELKGAGRSIHVSTVEVEKSANCEQVVFEEKGGQKTCTHFAAYSGLRAAAEEGAKYTSAICHTVGKRGPIGPQGPKGKQGEEGPAGGVGKAGEKGDVGEVGPVGEQGEAGEEGPEGIAADVTGLATMGQLNIAGGLCILVTVAIAVILMQKASPKSGRRASGGPPKEEAVEGEEGEAMPEEGEEAAEGEMMEEGEEQPM